MQSNLAYLEDELSRISVRIEKGESWLDDNPAVSYFIRNIKGYEYIYGSQRIGEKISSQLISKNLNDLPALKEKSQERRRLKSLVSDLKKQRKAIERQIKIAEKVLAR